MLLDGRDEIDLQFHRLAITEEQIAEFDLPSLGRKATAAPSMSRRP
jgi:hypothetical protein